VNSAYMQRQRDAQTCNWVLSSHCYVSWFRALNFRPASQNPFYYSDSNGRTSFALPNLKDRVPIHAGTGPGLTQRRLGELGGAATVTLTSNQVPSHNHNDIVEIKPHNHSTTSTSTVSLSGNCSVSSPDHDHALDSHVHETTFGFHVEELDGNLHVVAYSNDTSAQCMTKYVSSSGGDQCFISNDVTTYNLTRIPSSATTSGGSLRTEEGKLPSGPCVASGDVDLTNVTTSDDGITAQTTTVGGGQAHNNEQPYLTINYIIAYEFPSIVH